MNFTGPDGAYPVGRLALGGDGSIYGTTLGGDFRGTAFRLTTSAPFLTSAHVGQCDWHSRFGGLVRGADGDLCGATSAGGANGTGFFFRVATTGAITALTDFAAGEGNSERGPLLLGRDGKFYGSERHGGTQSEGLLFRVSPSGIIEVLANFSPGDFGDKLTNPVGSLVQDAQGYIVGNANRGGVNRTGGIFRWRAGGPIETLYNCAADGYPGKYPISGLFLAPDGKLIGAFSNDGELFAYSTSYFQKVAPFTSVEDEVTTRVSRACQAL